MAASESPPAYPQTERRTLQLGLGAAAIGALVILLSLFGALFSVVGLALIVIGTVVTAPAARGGTWWNLLALGAVISAAAALVQLVSQTLGGLLAVAGGVLVLIGVSLGYPLDE